ncbi:acyltransferase [Blautia sp. HCP3S3_C4]|uniref:acyltransferase n=1 Tax=Blautia sp. HCP3S3_C4 TaxID=3438911 RepID=UPI003F887763
MNSYRLKRGLLTCLSAPINNLKMRLLGVEIGRGFGSCGIITLVKLQGCMTIGNNSYINSHRIADPIGGQNRTILQLAGGKLIIGNRVGISNTAICCANSVIIEDDVTIGAGCKIYDTDFHSPIAEYRLNGNTHVRTAPVHIKERAFIGGHSIILKGVTIGRESVIGAGSVVTCDVPDGEIWAGNPAKYVKRVDDCREI